MRVNVDDIAFMDRRFKLLGGRLGMAWQEALGRCLPVWALAYAKRTPILPAGDIDALAERTGFAAAMVAVDLASEEPSDGVYLCGVNDRIDFLLMQDAKREKAREARLAAVGIKKSPGPSRGKRNESPGPSRGEVPRTGSYSPDLAPDHLPDLEDQKVSLPRDPSVPVPHQPVTPAAIDNSRAQAMRGNTPQTENGKNLPVPGIGNHDPDCNRPRILQPTPDFATDAQEPRSEPERPRRKTIPTSEDRRAIREEIRGLINAARTRVGGRLGTTLYPCLPFDRGLDSDLSGQLALATTRTELEAIAAQARHAVAMAEIEAVADPERVQFLTGAIFAGGNFARLAGKTAATAALVRPRAGPKSSAARAPENRDIRVGAVQPSDPSLYPDGVIEIP